MAHHSDIDLFAEISKLLRYHETLGIKAYPRTRMLERFLQRETVPSPEGAGGKSQPEKRKTSKAAVKGHVFAPVLTPKATLRDVREELGDCTRCSLHKTRTSIVFGQGPESAKLLIVADMPGGEDDQQAAPVQGEAGDLLEKMLAAIGLSRDEVYITTLVKCYPGAHAEPGEIAIKTCLPFLFRQIEIICPRVICTMGLQSAQTLLRSRRSLFQLRGRFYNFSDLCSDPLQDTIVLMPSLHPSLLLANADLKKASWQDLQMIRKKLEEK